MTREIIRVDRRVSVDERLKARTGVANGGGRTSSLRILFFPSQSSSRLTSFSSPLISCVAEDGRGKGCRVSLPDGLSRLPPRPSGRTDPDPVSSELERPERIRESIESLDARDFVLDEVDGVQVGQVVERWRVRAVGEKRSEEVVREVE